MLLKLLWCVVSTLAASTNKDAEPRRAVVTQEYWDNIYQVHVSPEHYRHGKLVIPDKKNCPWNVELDVLDASEAERLFENVPLIRELQDTCRKAVADVEDQGYEINAAKVGGYSTIGVTISIKNDEIQQSYTLQKRIGWSCEVDYAGSPRFKPAVELLFDPNADIIINWDCGVVHAELANKAEGTAWFRQMIVLGKEHSEKCLQMPIGRIPRWGLTETQRKGISEYGPDHHRTDSV
jgi:hypothetical protein